MDAETTDQAGAPPAPLGTLPADPLTAGGSGPLDLSAIARGDDGYSMGDLAATPGPTPGPDDGVIVLGGPLDPPDPQAPGALPAPPAAIPDGTGDVAVAATVLDEDPRAQYDRAYGFVVDGNYQMAEAGFRQFLKANGSSSLAGDAHFWLGESLYARGRFRDAADSFLTTYRDYPNSGKAPESLLKLGLSLEGLGETDAACATYRELEKKFASAPASLLQKVANQKSQAGC
jgi:tol-pal system protein YbgF